MGRSLKKGPFADASVLKKVDAMNESVLRLGPADPRFSLLLSDIRSPYTTDVSMFPYISLRTW